MSNSTIYPQGSTPFSVAGRIWQYVANVWDPKRRTWYEKKLTEEDQRLLEQAMPIIQSQVPWTYEKGIKRIDFCVTPATHAQGWVHKVVSLFRDMVLGLKKPDKILLEENVGVVYHSNLTQIAQNRRLKIQITDLGNSPIADLRQKMRKQLSALTAHYLELEDIKEKFRSPKVYPKLVKMVGEKNVHAFEKSSTALLLASQTTTHTLEKIEYLLSKGQTDAAALLYASQLPALYERLYFTWYAWKQDTNKIYPSMTYGSRNLLAIHQHVIRDLQGSILCKGFTPIPLSPFEPEALRDREGSSIKNRMRHAQLRDAKHTQLIKNFTKSYQGNRELFEETMRKHGISDSKSAFLYSRFVSLGQRLERWDKTFASTVMPKEDKEQITAAYVQLIESQYPSLLEEIELCSRDKEELFDPLCIRAFSDFAQEMGLPRETIVALVSLPQLVEAKKQDIDYLYRAGGKKRKTLKDLHKQIDSDFLHIQSNMDPAAPRFQYGTHMAQLLQEPVVHMHSFADTTLGDEWKDVLLNHYWTDKKKEAFIQLYEEYGEVAKELHQAKEAIKIEKNTQKKRALFLQWRRQAERALPTIRNLDKRWKDLKGDATIGNFQKTVSTFARNVEKMPPTLAWNEEQIEEGIREILSWKPETIRHLLEKLIADEKGGEEILLRLSYLGWSKEKYTALSQWCDHYAELAKPIALAQQAVQKAPKDVYAQQKRLEVLQENMSQLSVLMDDLYKHIGDKSKLQLLQGCLQAYIEQREKEGGFERNFEPRSLDFMEKLERINHGVLSIDTAVRGMRYDFVGKVVERKTKEIAQLLEMTKEAQRCCDEVYEDLHLLRATSCVQQALDIDPHSVQGFYQFLVQQNSLWGRVWSVDKIKSFDKWYIDYMDTTYSLIAKKDALAKDPQNPRLQGDLSEQISHTQSKRQALTAKFNKEFTRESVGYLRHYVALYQQKLQAEILHYRQQQDKPGTSERMIVAEIRKKEKAIEAIRSLDWSGLDKRIEDVEEIMNMTSVPMSWNQNFLLPFKERNLPAWPPKEASLKVETINEVISLHKACQMQLNPLLLIERGLEESPGNTSNREILREKMVLSMPQLKQIEEQYALLKPAIERFQEAIVVYRGQLKESIETLKITPLVLKTKRMKKDYIPEMLSQSVEELQTHLYKIRGIDIKEDFAQKIAEMRDLQKRFS